MPKRNATYFNENWFKDSRFSSWIEKGQENTSAKCKVCCKVISSMKVYHQWELALLSRMHQARNT